MDRKVPQSGQANLDASVVEGFGDEWCRFTQSDLGSQLEEAFRAYFRIFPWGALPPDAAGFDLGCGSGRWARFVAPKVGSLLLIDPSSAALEVARSNLAGDRRIEFLCASAGDLPLPDESFDFGYSLGVLHHTPDPLRGLSDAVRILRPGAPMLVYLYYALDNRSWAYRALWRASDVPRRIISRTPRMVKNLVCDVIATCVYWPLSRIAKVVDRLGGPADVIPLSAYRNLPFYSLRTDSLDRFGTRLELRFTREEVADLLMNSGLVDVRVSDELPYWCAVGVKPVRG